MPRGQTLESEEELCRSKEENQSKQQLPNTVLSPRIVSVTGNFQIPWTGPGLGLKQEITETPQIKEEPEEQSIKQEEEQLPVTLPESSAVCVKTEESSLLQQRQTEHREETQGEDISSEPHFHSETEEHTENSYYNQVQTRDSTHQSPQNKSAPETTVPSEHVSGAHEGGAERKKHQCSVCNEEFTSNDGLEKHIRVHVGEKPFSCSFCEKAFAKKSYLDVHKRTHTGEKPYTCSDCNKSFSSNSGLWYHSKTHIRKRQFSCSICGQTFARKSHLHAHKNRKNSCSQECRPVSVSCLLVSVVYN